MKASERREIRSAGISTSTIDDDHIRVLTTAPRIKPTSIFLRSARRPNPGRGSTYRRGIFVQTTGTTSVATAIGSDDDPDRYWFAVLPASLTWLESQIDAFPKRAQASRGPPAL